MNRYPVWKYAIIVIVLLVGLLYALPNFFGEAPAVQVSAAKSTVKVDDSTRNRIEAALKAANLQPDMLTLDVEYCTWANPNSQLVFFPSASCCGQGVEKTGIRAQADPAHVGLDGGSFHVVSPDGKEEPVTV